MRTLLACIVAVMAVSSATALAAGELITRGDQIASGVIDNSHVKTQSLGKAALAHPTLRLRVTESGGVRRPARRNGPRQSTGVYVVTFDIGVLGGSYGPRNPRWLDTCAVTATPRTGGYSDGRQQDATLTTMRTMTSAIIVLATRPDYTLQRSVLRDAPFDIAAIC